MNDDIRDALSSFGSPAGDLRALPDSTKRFADGGQFRIEIPSTEGEAGLDAVRAEAARLGVPVHRVSQGSGVMFLTDAELDAMASAARDARYELSLFARPNAGWTASAMSMSSAGALAAPLARGADQLAHVLADVIRAAEHGVRSVLIGDPGALAAFGALRRNGALPESMQAKTSVMMPAANPVTARIYEQLGAGSLNLPVDLELGQIAAIRAAVEVPLDVYIEAPENLGGFVQTNLLPEIIRVAAPVYIKFGLRNAPDIYPMGAHLGPVAIAASRERVRRACLALELLDRSGTTPAMSPIGSDDLRVPVPVPSPTPVLATATI